MNTSSAFSSSYLSNLSERRNTRFHLDLSNSSMVEILEAKSAYMQKQNPKYSNNNVVKLIRRLERQFGQEILPIDITDEFYSEVQDYLLETPNERGQILKPSSIKLYFDIISSTLSWAAKHKCTISETYNAYHVNAYEKTKVALNPSQIAHIYYYDLNNNGNRAAIRKVAKKRKLNHFSFSVMKRVRDQFVLECNIGQRYSDASRIERSNFDGTGTIYKVTQQKTGGKAVVNIARYSIDKGITIEILKKYQYMSPAYGVDINVCNRYLHTLLQAIGGEFSEDVKTENKIHGRIVTETDKMYELITTHTARRTFVTYWANNKEMSVTRLQRCTGHKDVRQISRYTILNDEE